MKCDTLAAYLARTARWVALVSILGLAPLLAAAEENSAPAEAAKGPVGFMDRTGNVAIEPQFDDALSFSEGLSAVKQGEKWGYIDHAGRFVIPPRFQSAGSFCEGRAAVYVKGEEGETRAGHIDRTGRFVSEPRFESVGTFYEGLALVWWREPGQEDPEDHWAGRRSGYVDADGKLVLTEPKEHEAHFVAPFSEGRAIFYAGIDDNAKCGFIDRRGRILIPAKYRRAEHFTEGLAAVQNDEGLWGLIDPNGELVIPHKYPYVLGFSNGLANILVDGKWGYIDQRGMVVIPPVFRSTFGFQEGSAIASKEDSSYLIDRRGDILVEFDLRHLLMPGREDDRFRRFVSFSEGLIAFEDKSAREKGAWRVGFLDRNGKVAIEPKYPEVMGFSEGLAAFSTKLGVWTMFIESIDEEQDEKQPESSSPERKPES